MAKKGREARITRTIAKIRGEKLSEALRRRAASRPDDADGGRSASTWKKRKARARARVDARGTAGAPHGYDGSQKTLLVGDGNLSFGLALVTLFGGDGSGVVATTALGRGASAAAHGTAFEDTVEALEASGASVAYGVECESLASEGARRALRERIGGGSFDRVTFNFPDAGCGRVGELSVRAQRALLTSYFENASKVLKSSGEIRVTLRTSAPYSGWNVEALAQKAGLAFKARVEFDASEFPGYEYSRTIDEEDAHNMDGEDEDDAAWETEEGPGEDAATYVFVRASAPPASAK